ncbi:MULTISPECIES: hypothetical protein [Shewanella]|uniref:Uncharacterized protein n=1 Tax=Shewanella marisflavi TaxID=260364 RepID=A0ABX5WNG4_9GAMM|nr:MULTISPECIES: hypothetical protein [Shewanella]QDF75937.1 hypothetical protein FGA12_12715 [Shewanella marisflavi]
MENVDGMSELNKIIKLIKEGICNTKEITEEERLAEYQASDAGKAQLNAEIDLLENCTDDELKFCNRHIVMMGIDPSPAFLKIKSWIDSNQPKNYKYPDDLDGNEFIAVLLKGAFLEGNAFPSLRNHKANHRPTVINNTENLTLLKQVKETSVSEVARKHGIGRQVVQSRLKRFAETLGVTYTELKEQDITVTCNMLYFKGKKAF